MIRTPAQHQRDPAKAAGQRVGDLTLADYIKRKEEVMKPKLTFDQWFETKSGFSEYSRSIARSAWTASRENM